MTGLAVGLVGASAGVVTLALFAWWLIRHTNSLTERAVRGEAAEARARDLELALHVEREAHAATRARYQRAVTGTIPKVDDATAVELAGGDPGPGRPSDGLLDPWGPSPSVPADPSKP